MTTNTVDDARLPDHAGTLRDLLVCCLSWVPQACVMGNVRAGDAAAAIDAAIVALTAAGAGGEAHAARWIAARDAMTPRNEVAVCVAGEGGWVQVTGDAADAAIDRFVTTPPPAPDGDAVAVDRGALQLAINVLRRAGKDEVADELASATRPAPDMAALVDFVQRVAAGPGAGCGCSPVCRCLEPEAVRIWAEVIRDEAKDLQAPRSEGVVMPSPVTITPEEAERMFPSNAYKGNGDEYE